MPLGIVTGYQPAFVAASLGSEYHLIPSLLLRVLTRSNVRSATIGRCVSAHRSPRVIAQFDKARRRLLPT
jgi:hypothetical protein